MCLLFVSFSPVPVKNHPRLPRGLWQNQDIGGQSPNIRSSSHRNVDIKPSGVAEGKQDLPSASTNVEALKVLQKILEKIPEDIMKLCYSFTRKVSERKELEVKVAGMQSSFSPESCVCW